MGTMKSGKAAGPSSNLGDGTMPAGVGWEGNARGLENECSETNI